MRYDETARITFDFEVEELHDLKTDLDYYVELCKGIELEAATQKFLESLTEILSHYGEK